MLLTDCKRDDRRAVRHAAFAAARANFHNQSIVANLPGAEHQRGRPQPMQQLAGRMTGTAVTFSEFHFGEVSSKPKHNGPGGSILYFRKRLG